MEKHEKSMPEADAQPPHHCDPLHKGLILVAEDDPDIAKMLSIYLEGLGYEVWLAKQGEEVLQTCIEVMPNAVILDPSLPEVSGREVYQELRSNPQTKHIPIVFIPEESEAYAALEGVQLGATAEFVTKPFDLEEIKRDLERVVPRHPDAPGTVLWQSDEG